MCNQTGGLVGAEIERHGIPTTAQIYLRNVAEMLQPPRALWVPFAHGYALGKPNDRKLQLSVLRQTFALLDEPGPGPVIKDYVAEKIPIGMHMG